VIEKEIDRYSFYFQDITVLYLKVWDVQYGNAIYIKTPNSKHFVLDLGGGSLKKRDAVFSPLEYLKDKMKVDQLDEVIVTHPHGDHIRDITNFDLLNPRAFYRPGHLTEEDITAANRIEDRPLIDKYIEINNRYVEAVNGSDSPLQTNNNGGANIEMFLATNSDRSNVNNHSVVTVISYAESKILISGDNEKESWQELLQQTGFKEAIKGTEVYFAAHHGMESGYCAALFEQIHPKIVIISNGRFTDDSCLERYSGVASGLMVHRLSAGDVEKKCLTTKHDGNIEIAVGWVKKGKKSYLTVTSE